MKAERSVLTEELILMWYGAQEFGSETSQYLNSAVLQWLWPAGRRQVFLGAKGRQQGRQGVLVAQQGRQGLCCHGQSAAMHPCLLRTVRTHSQSQAHQVSDRAQGEETHWDNKQLTHRHGQQNQSSGIFPTMRRTPPTTTMSPGAGKRWRVKVTGSWGAVWAGIRVP